MLKLLSRGVLYSDTRFMAAFPSVCVIPVGEVLLVFRRAPDHRWLLGASYDDAALEEHGGEHSDLEARLYHWDARSQLVAMRFAQSDLRPTQEPIGLSVDGQAADQDASLLVLPDGDILLSSFSWYPMPPAFAALAKAWKGKPYGGPANAGSSYIAWGSYARRSADLGASWSERKYLPELPGAAPLVPGLRTSHGGCVRGQAVLRDGEILMPSYSEVGGTYSAHLFASRDGGSSFEYRSLMAKLEGRHIYEPSLTVTRDGELIAWLRTDDPQDRMASARSTDGGHSWEPCQLHETVGHPAHGLRLSSGEILLTYGYRHQGFGVRAKLLDASGRNIDSSEEFVLRDDGPGTDLGYPWAVQLDDGRILVVYYFTDDHSTRNISYSLLAP